MFVWIVQCQCLSIFFVIQCQGKGLVNGWCQIVVQCLGLCVWCIFNKQYYMVGIGFQIGVMYIGFQFKVVGRYVYCFGKFGFEFFCYVNQCVVVGGDKVFVVVQCFVMVVNKV